MILSIRLVDPISFPAVVEADCSNGRNPWKKGLRIPRRPCRRPQRKRRKAFRAQVVLPNTIGMGRDRSTARSPLRFLGSLFSHWSQKGHRWVIESGSDLVRVRSVEPPFPPFPPFPPDQRPPQTNAISSGFFSRFTGGNKGNGESGTEKVWVPQRRAGLLAHRLRSTEADAAELELIVDDGRRSRKTRIHDPATQPSDASDVHLSPEIFSA